VHVAAAEELRVDASEREVGVGRGCLLPAEPVRRRTGERAGRARADVQLAEVVDPGDAAPAVADLHQVDDRHHDRVAGGPPVSLDPVVGHDPHAATLDQRALRGRAADVEREDVRIPDQPSELRGAPEAARRAALDHGDRDALDMVERVDAAVRLHDVRLAAEAVPRETLVQPAQVPLGDGLHVGRQHCGAAALVLPPLPRDLV
jgi:hypothetical protein